MLGDTLTVTLGGSGGTARVCSKINQDGYSAEYLNRSATDEVRVKVRHSKESASKNGVGNDRHNVEITQTVFATATTPERVRQVYLVIRHKPDDAEASVTDLAESLVFWASSANLQKLANWES